MAISDSVATALGLAVAKLARSIQVSTDAGSNWTTLTGGGVLTEESAVEEYRDDDVGTIATDRRAVMVCPSTSTVARGNYIRLSSGATEWEVIGDPADVPGGVKCILGSRTMTTATAARGR